VPSVSFSAQGAGAARRQRPTSAAQHHAPPPAYSDDAVRTLNAGLNAVEGKLLKERRAAHREFVSSANSANRRTVTD